MKNISRVFCNWGVVLLGCAIVLTGCGGPKKTPVIISFDRPEVEVWLDGESMGVTGAVANENFVVEVEGGTYELRARAQGSSPYYVYETLQTIEVVPGELLRLFIELKEEMTEAGQLRREREAEAARAAAMQARKQQEQEIERALLADFQRLGNFDPATAAREITLRLPGFVPLQLIKVPAGSFVMGSAGDEYRRQPHEGPQVEVTITRPFWLGRFEITQAQWMSVMIDNPSEFTRSGPLAPVDSVSWYDAMEFCRRLTESALNAGTLPEGWVFTLPTEAQWEYAARAGTQTPFAFGDSLGYRQANIDGHFPYGDAARGEFRQRTLPVGSFSPNAWGFYDMHGNVREWCYDWYQDSYAPVPVTDPRGPLRGSFRINRGGSWLHDAHQSRSAHRMQRTPSFRLNFIGFRIALAYVGEDAHRWHPQQP